MKKEEKFAIEPIVEFDAVSDDELGAIVGGADPMCPYDYQICPGKDCTCYFGTHCDCNLKFVP